MINGPVTIRPLLPVHVLQVVGDELILITHHVPIEPLGPDDTATPASRAMTTVGWGHGRMTRHGIIICGDQHRRVTDRDGFYHCEIRGEQVPWIPPPFAALAIHPDLEPYLFVGWHWFDVTYHLNRRIVHLRLHGGTYRPVPPEVHKLNYLAIPSIQPGRSIDESITPTPAGQPR